jgi:hypothetical protein
MLFTFELFACEMRASLPDRLDLKSRDGLSLDDLLLPGPLKFDRADPSPASLLGPTESRVLHQKPEETFAGFVIVSSFPALMLWLEELDEH